MRMPEFVHRVKATIDEELMKSTRALMRDLQVDEATIRRVAHEYLISSRTWWGENGSCSREPPDQSQAPLEEAETSRRARNTVVLLRWENFVLCPGPEGEPKNDRWLNETPKEVWPVIHTKFPASIVVLGVVSSEGDVMAPHFFFKVPESTSRY